MLRRLTIEDVKQWKPCASDVRLYGLAGSLPSPCSPLEAFDALLGQLPNGELIWLMTQWLIRYHPGRLIWWMMDVSELALALPGSNPHKSPIERTIRVIRQAVCSHASSRQCWQAAAAVQQTKDWHRARLVWYAADLAAAILQSPDHVLRGRNRHSGEARLAVNILVNQHVSTQQQLDRLRPLLLRHRPPDDV